MATAEEPDFTTRPELLGDHGLVASTHWVATAVGVSILEQGGNAADAAVATGLALQVVEPHLCGPGGEVPIIVRGVDGAVEVICGQGVAPMAATIGAFAELGVDSIPGAGLLAATVPGAWGAWMLLLERHGTMTPAQVLSPAISLAEQGFPISHQAGLAIRMLTPIFRDVWPSCAAVWLAGGSGPKPGQRWRWPALAATWRRILAEAGSGSREQQIERARAAWYSGFVAEDIDAFCAAGSPDVDGTHREGLLVAEDLHGWRATVEETLSLHYDGWGVHKTQSWGQGPVQLLWLSLLAGVDLPDDDTSAEWVHLVTETGKLAMADREAWFGDPRVADVPMSTLLSEDYARQRRALVGAEASYDLRPGSPDGRSPRIPDHPVLTDERSTAHLGGGLMPGLDDATLRPDGSVKGDTCHLDVADRAGLVISATPSGGWLQSSPVIPSLGFPLGSRLQMAWLDADHPAGLVPGARPRTTLTPSLAVHDDGRVLAYGTPGGDQQDQWSILLLLRHLAGRNLQDAIDAPAFHSEHAPSSFWPRQARPGRLVLEERFSPEVIEGLRQRGHDVQVLGPWSQGRLSAAQWEPEGWLRAAANPRGMNGYAAGR